MSGGGVDSSSMCLAGR
nr:hypothetical protein [Tanacetum cinerariifolium]